MLHDKFQLDSILLNKADQSYIMKSLSIASSPSLSSFFEKMPTVIFPLMIKFDLFYVIIKI